LRFLLHHPLSCTSRFCVLLPPGLYIIEQCCLLYTGSGTYCPAYAFYSACCTYAYLPALLPRFMHRIKPSDPLHDPLSPLSALCSAKTQNVSLPEDYYFSDLSLLQPLEFKDADVIKKCVLGCLGVRGTPGARRRIIRMVLACLRLIVFTSACMRVATGYVTEYVCVRVGFQTCPRYRRFE